MKVKKKLTDSIFYTPKEEMGKPWTYTDETRQALDSERAKGTVTPRVDYVNTLAEKPFKPKGPRIGYYNAKVGSERNLPSPFVDTKKPKKKHWLPKTELATGETIHGKRTNSFRKLRETYKP